MSAAIISHRLLAPDENNPRDSTNGFVLGWPKKRKEELVTDRWKEIVASLWVAPTVGHVPAFEQASTIS